MNAACASVSEPSTKTCQPSVASTYINTAPALSFSNTKSDASPLMFELFLPTVQAAVPKFPS
jgi:hypothetical protein